MSHRFDQAKEKITKIFVQEYCKKNPGVSENEVIVKCQDGTLVFTDVASVLAEMKIHKSYQKALENAGKMYASLAAHENQRWNDCIKSTEHSKMMVDCLHSSPFLYYSPMQWNEFHQFLIEQEELCAKYTVCLENCKSKINHLKKEGFDARSKEGRTVVIEYLQWVIDQLKVLHCVFQKEVEIGEDFSDKAKEFIDVTFHEVETKTVDFQLNAQELDRLYQSTQGDSQQSLQLQNIEKLNTDILIRTKKALTEAVDNLKEHLITRREQFQDIWSAISQMQTAVENIEEFNELDIKGLLDFDIDDLPSDESKPGMVRFSKPRKRKDR